MSDSPLYRAAFPAGPLVDPQTGEVTQPWFGLFQSLYVRTGGANGLSSNTSGLQANLAAEEAGRITADQALNDAIAALPPFSTTLPNMDAAVAATGTAATTSRGDHVHPSDSNRLSLGGGILFGPLIGPAGIFAVVQTGSDTGPTWTRGSGVPTAVEPLGSLFSRTDGAVGATLYVSRGGGTWLAVAGV
jgi:hypothetical protein